MNISSLSKYNFAYGCRFNNLTFGANKNEVCQMLRESDYQKQGSLYEKKLTEKELGTMLYYFYPFFAQAKEDKYSVNQIHQTLKISIPCTQRIGVMVCIIVIIYGDFQR